MVCGRGEKKTIDFFSKLITNLKLIQTVQPNKRVQKVIIIRKYNKINRKYYNRNLKFLLDRILRRSTLRFINIRLPKLNNNKNKLL